MTTLDRVIEGLDVIDEKHALDSLSSSLLAEENPVIESARTIISVSPVCWIASRPTQLTFVIEY